MNASPLRTVARLTFGNLASRIYLGVVAVAITFGVVDTLFVDHADASLAAVWMFFATMPTSLVILPRAEVPAGVLLALVVVAGLVQATVIGLIHRALRGDGHAVSA